MLTNKKNEKVVQNTGFASDGKSPTSRFIHKNGTLNVDFHGKYTWQQHSFYHSLLHLSHLKFLLLIFVFYSTINLIFAGIYMLIGVEHLAGVIGTTTTEKFTEAYFFSSQTLTTLGYGRISPVGFLANIASFTEAFIGLVTFALITGLLYGRFTKPRAYIKFSDIAIISPFNEMTGLMFRLAPTKSTTVSNLTASVVMSMNIEKDGVVKNTFFTLPLQLSKIMSLALSWTIVHPIDEESPLFGMTKNDIDFANVHLMVYIEGFDEGFSNTVVARTEYLCEDILTGLKFLPMFRYNEEERRNQLRLNEINEVREVG